MPVRLFVCLWMGPWITACAPEPLPVVPGAPFNILLVLVDDVGLDLVSSYGGRVDTPHIDALADRGIRFTHAYSNPTCSPSRMSLLTGRHPTRTGIGRWIRMPSHSPGLRERDITLPDVLAASPWDYTTAAVGKWHLNPYSEPRAAFSPTERGGFDTYAGPLGNPRDSATSPAPDGPPLGYELWEKTTQGEVTWESTYMTTDTIDDAIAQLASLPEPWFLWVAPSSAHEPWHVPPAELHHHPELTSGSAIAARMDAMVEALDHELGRLLAAMTDVQREHTVIVFAADNGTDQRVIVEPWDAARSKSTTFDGGVNVPFVVSGPMVAEPGSVSDALVHFVDVFSLVAELASVRIKHEVDGRSFLPVIDGTTQAHRDWVFTEQFYPNGDVPDGSSGYVDRTVRARTHKYRRRIDNGVTIEGLYRYRGVRDALDEGPDLLDGPLDAEDGAALIELRALLQAQIDAM